MVAPWVINHRLLRWIARRVIKNPTTPWGASMIDELIVDVGAGTVNGIRIGSAFDAFSPMGQPSDGHPALDCALSWAPLGLELELELREAPPVVTGVNVDLEEAEALNAHGAVARRLVTPQGTLTLVPGLCVDDVVAALGQPTEVDSDDEEAVLTYQFDSYTAALDVVHEVGLTYVSVFSTGSV